MSKIQDTTEVKISTYKHLMTDQEKNIKDYNSLFEKQSYVNENSYPIIYETLEKYSSIIKNALAQDNISQDEAKIVHIHLVNLKKLFIEHQNNLTNSLRELKGKIIASETHKKKLQELLNKEQQYLKHILDGNITEDGAYIGDPARRPPGVRPVDPMLERKKKNK